jgi:hypothetical protein
MALSVFLFVVIGFIGLMYGIFKCLCLFKWRDLNDYFLNIAESIDRLGNVVAGTFLMNDIMSSEKCYRFGNGRETISKVMGKNKKMKTITEIENNFAKILNRIEPNHVEKASEEN